MNILFLNPPFGCDRPEGLDAPMGIMCLSAVLKAQGHACRLVDNVWEKAGDWSAWRSALKEKTDIVLVNTQIRFEDATREAIQLLRAECPSVLAIAFGPQASTEAPRLLAEMGFDGCVVGEPEQVVPQVLETIATGLRSCVGFATKDQPVVEPAPRVDVESLPFPDWELADYGRYIRQTHNAVFFASRGMNRPSICNQPPLLYATTPTHRCSVPRVLQELTELRHLFPGNYMVLFHDEVFTEDRDWVLELCEGLRTARLGLPFWCFTRPNLVDDALCRAMARAGFAGISMAIDSGSPRILEMIGKGVTCSQIEAGFQAAQKAGLLTVGSVMLGMPELGPEQKDETPAEVEATLQLVARVRPDVLTTTIATPLPGTLLYERVQDRLLAKSPADFNYLHSPAGKYPVRLNELTPEMLTDAITRMRAQWKRGLLKTVAHMGLLALRNGGFRRNMVSQTLKTVRRKVFAKWM